MLRADIVLADFAQVVGGKLFISGGGVSGVHFHQRQPQGQPYVVSFAVAGTVTYDWDVAAGPHTIGFEVVDEDGHPPVSVDGSTRLPLAEGQSFDLAHTSPPVVGAEVVVPFAFFLPNVPLAAPGRYTVSLLVDASLVGAKTFTVELHLPSTDFGSGPTRFQMPQA